MELQSSDYKETSHATPRSQQPTSSTLSLETGRQTKFDGLLYFLSPGTKTALNLALPSIMLSYASLTSSSE